MTPLRGTPEYEQTHFPLFAGLEARQPPSLLYHYTDQRGLTGILGSRTVYATHLRYLNDSAEYDLALLRAAEVIGARKRLLDTPKQRNHLDGILHTFRQLGRDESFVFSLSRHDDQLSQWRGYCSAGSGFSIGFATAALQRGLDPNVSRLLPCVYEADEQRGLIAEIVDLAYARATDPDVVADGDQLLRSVVAAATRFALVAPIIKHEKFREEDEWRLVAFVPSARDPRKPHDHPLSVVVRPGQSMLTPYIRLRIAHEHPAEVVDLFPRIVVGPTAHPDLARAAVEFALVAARVHVPSVEKSAIPYRAW
jgi:hypothetical protein